MHRIVLLAEGAGDIRPMLIAGELLLLVVTVLADQHEPRIGRFVPAFVRQEVATGRALEVAEGVGTLALGA